MSNRVNLRARCTILLKRLAMAARYRYNAMHGAEEFDKCGLPMSQNAVKEVNEVHGNKNIGDRTDPWRIGHFRDRLRRPTAAGFDA